MRAAGTQAGDEHVIDLVAAGVLEPVERGRGYVEVAAQGQRLSLCPVERRRGGQPAIADRRPGVSARVEIRDPDARAETNAVDPPAFRQPAQTHRSVGRDPVRPHEDRVGAAAV